MAAAGSDARMNGCEMPVIINSGSGNQGITASVPVVIFARELGVSEEKMYRALALSNLTAIHQKTPIGRLSAFCGAISAGVGAGAGISYLKGGDYKVLIHTVVNALAIVSGIVCDGAIRDRGALAQMEDFPVYARSVTPNGPTKAGPGEIGGPVVVGGRSVRPGDIVAADEDGVVVVPMERADAVADAAHALQEKEEKILHRILQDGVFDRPWLNAQLQALGCAPSKG